VSTEQNCIPVTVQTCSNPVAMSANLTEVCCCSHRPLHAWAGHEHLTSTSFQSSFIAKQWLRKQRPLLGNSKNIQARNNRVTGLCNTFLSNAPVNAYNNWGIVGNGVFGPCIVVIKMSSIESSRVMPCGGGFTYLHRSPASRKRRRKRTKCLGV
jgi:hypothetical protein